MPAKLSINVNKVALLRNSRGRGVPDLLGAADICIGAGAHGITVHPRMDQRHIRFDDVPVLGQHLRERHVGVELNVECENAPSLIELVCEVKPDQCTLVPVTPGEVTSDHGFTATDVEALQPTVARLKQAGVRVSLFMDCDPTLAAPLARSGADRVELYTGPYAWAWGGAAQAEQTRAVWQAAEAAVAAGMGVNAGHDLDAHNLAGLRDLEALEEVSIGHAHICRALEVGMASSVRELLEALGHDPATLPGKA